MKTRSIMLVRNAVYAIITFGVVSSVFIYFVPLNLRANQDNKEKTIFFADNMTAAHNLIIKQFNKKNKGYIKVVPINLDHHKLNTNKRKALITRNLSTQRSKVDIFAIDYIWLPRFVKWSEPLTKYFAKKDLTNIYPELLPACYDGGQLYAIPFFYDIGVLFYRGDILAQITNHKKWREILRRGITWDEMARLKNTYSRSKPFYVVQAKAYEGLICNYLEIGAGKGVKMFDGNKFNFSGKKIFELNKSIFSLFHSRHIISQQSLHFDEEASFTYGLKNDFLFIRSWVTNICNLKFPKNLNLKLKQLRMAALPRDKSGPPLSALGGWNLIISKYSRNKKEAAEFLKFVISEKAQNELYKMGCNMPVLNTIDLSLPSRNGHLARIIKEGWIKNSIRRPANVDYTRISEIYARLLNQMLQGNRSIDDELNLARKAQNDL